MRADPQDTVDLATFTKEIRNGKLQFFWNGPGEYSVCNRDYVSQWNYFFPVLQRENSPKFDIFINRTSSFSAVSAERCFSKAESSTMLTAYFFWLQTLRKILVDCDA